MAWITFTWNSLYNSWTSFHNDSPYYLLNIQDIVTRNSLHMHPLHQLLLHSNFSFDHFTVFTIILIMFFTSTTFLNVLYFDNTILHRHIINILPIKHHQYIIHKNTINNSTVIPLTSNSTKLRLPRTHTMTSRLSIGRSQVIHQYSSIFRKY